MSVSSEPITFEFIADPGFRTSLERDYAELLSSIQVGAWKAALVLSGSIVEAVLADYLAFTGQTKPDPLKMELGPLIEACAKIGALDQRARELSSVIRSYHNLIHPGRVVRLNEAYGPEDAQVAVHVLRIIIREIANRQEEDFGLTAEQAATKFETDSSAPFIAAPLLSEMREEEVRGLFDVVPERYFEIEEGDWRDDARDSLDRLAILCRAAFDGLPESARKIAAKKYLAVLRGDAESRVDTYDQAFFRGTDLEYMTKAERDMVIAHVLGRLAPAQRAPTRFITSVAGIGAHLDSKQLTRYVDGLARIVAYDAEPDRQKAVMRTLEDEFLIHTSSDQDERIRERLMGVGQSGGFVRLVFESLAGEHCDRPRVAPLRLDRAPAG